MVPFPLGMEGAPPLWDGGTADPLETRPSCVLVMMKSNLVALV